MEYNVYLVACHTESETLYKIGWTKRSVEERMNDFKTGNAYDFDILYQMKSKWGTKVEKRLHEYYKSKRVNREWFKLDKEDIFLFPEKCKMFHNNYDLLVNENTWIIDNKKRI